MKRRKMVGAQWAIDGPHGRPAKEIIQRWMRRGGKRRLNRLERQEGRRQTRESWTET